MCRECLHRVDFLPLTTAKEDTRNGTPMGSTSPASTGYVHVRLRRDSVGSGPQGEARGVALTAENCCNIFTLLEEAGRERKKSITKFSEGLLHQKLMVDTDKKTRSAVHP